MTALNTRGLSKLVEAIAGQIEQARNQVRQSVNSAMVQSYWQIGRLIVEEEQQGGKPSRLRQTAVAAAVKATDRTLG